MISIRSIDSGAISARSAWPVVGLFTRTPSTRICTWFGFAPRMLRLVVLPNDPERRISTPGTLRSASSTVGYRRVSISSPSMTVTVAPTCSAGVSIFVPVTMTGSNFFSSWAAAGTTAGSISSSNIVTTRAIAPLLLRRKGWMPRPRKGLLTRGSSPPPMPSRPAMPDSGSRGVSAGPGRRSPLTVARPCRLRRRDHCAPHRLPSLRDPDRCATP